jgi:hypothetical protein
MRFKSLFLASLLAVSCLTVTACNSTQPYRSGTVLEDANVDMLWDRAHLGLQSQGYQIDQRDTRRADLEITTQWQTQLVPTRYKGKRRKVHVRFIRLDSGRIQTAVLVEQQRNTEISDPLNLVAADWSDERDEFVAQREEVILYRIESFFVSNELE